ncbi:hypothetical protein SOCEGT47_036560 [Sorangium cellulosum]|uniref:Lcl C-terminal domain-containing protein n=1 Tax=Sorangium cellulosum TaxID=56 RepID=A0A4P2Q1K2_SORCE|nr:DUF1566 domain-containing protein [Sorangium cellulosum]AUX23137.1 hypothetical protein SOCEGT47_036560 [Sorangium cellulosum]
MPNETPYALRITCLMAVLLLESAGLAGCVGDPFQVGGGSGGGPGGHGGGGHGGSGSGGSGAGGGEPIGGGGTGGGEGGGPPAVPVTWPDSMTRRCSNGTTVVEACPRPSEPLFGQDGNYLITVPSYEEGNGVVTDSVTGLVWEKAAEDGSFHMAGALQHCEAIAASRLGGRDDWRLPTRRELVSLMDFGHTAAFPDIVTPYQDGFYWSATDVADDDSRAWGVLASNASLGYLDKIEATRARALCVGGESKLAPVELSVAESWVLDLSTGLVWQRQAALSKFSWSDALAHCEELELAGRTDWRLPSAKELLTLVDDARSGPAIDPEAFPGAEPGVFWSSTPALESADKALLVNFSNGASLSASLRDPRLVRCVRSDLSDG